MKIVKARGTQTPTHHLASTSCMHTQPYHPVSGSHGQLFCPYWGSSSWHNHQVNEWGKLVSQRPFTAGATPLSATP